MAIPVLVGARLVAWLSGDNSPAESAAVFLENSPCFGRALEKHTPQRKFYLAKNRFGRTDGTFFESDGRYVHL